MKDILIVNDDGINSPGIEAAVEAVKDLGRVTVVAPATQQSGVGRSLSLLEPLRIIDVSTPNTKAFSLGGTPVDAVIVALHEVMDKKPDLIVSGINIGENMSCEITTSGTVCAAMEGANQGVPSIAVSLHPTENKRPEKYSNPHIFDLTLAKDITNRVSKYLLKNNMPEGVDLLNINVPENGNSKVKITTLARNMYSAKVSRRYDPRGRPFLLIDGDPVYDAEKGTDVHTVRIENSVSITPLNLDLTSKSLDESWIKDVL
ncbi:MAG: 5'/3'-nucleotidase SurE [Candidatus Hydrothermarchaeales archaeon]